MRVLVCLLLVLSPTLFAALTSQHGGTAAAPEPATPTTAPEVCTHPLELETAREGPKSKPDNANRSQAAHSTR